MITPTPQQLAWQEAGFGLFHHFGVNTFNGEEWSDGTLSPASFDPSALDAAQWAATAAAAGAKYAILTAKHHDGFCLWPTATTDYSVASSPYRDGKGDVVREFTEAYRAAGLKVGLYLSPWDRNAPCYPDPAAYDDFYVRQLTELCTGYGELFEVWFDGAGSEGRTYDWDRIMGVIDKHQPDAMVFNLGRPSIRWVGNEDGLADDPCHYFTDSRGISIYADGEEDMNASAYLPLECDVPIRDNWFWQPDDLDTLKSREHLLAIWYRSMGLGAGLLLNLAPDRRGLIDDHDRDRLLETTSELRRRFADPQPARLAAHSGEVTLRWPEPVTLDHLELHEDLTEGQRIQHHEVLCDGRPIASGHTVGVRRLHAFPAVTTTELRVRLRGEEPLLRGATGYRTGVETPPVLED
ncbi:alpha-L-fucosidase [Streptomyces lavendulocolor]|uniref:alpha-L-fucosidase n=1 Tax=Streptomyces lavendulocolor TaxID=67316 RepID=UPI003C2B19E9